MCEYDSLLNQNIKSKVFIEGLFNRLKTNYFLLYSCIDSVQDETLQTNVRERLVNIMANEAPQFEN